MAQPELIKDIEARVKKSGDTMTNNLTVPTVIGSLQGNADTATKVNNKLTAGGKTFDGSTAVTINAADVGAVPTLTYEWNKELACGSNGLVCLGKFPCYDTNITIDIDSTTSTTYHGTLVIATQNINTTGGGSLKATVYGDATGTLSSAIKIQYGSGSNVVSVYCNFPGWSKNLVHVRAVALTSSASDVLTSVTSIPAAANRTATNALTTTYYHSNNKPSAADIGAVPTTRTINGKALSSNITLSKSDVGLSNIDNIKQYSASNPPPYPVTSVNGKTGDITVESMDVVELTYDEYQAIENKDSDTLYIVTDKSLSSSGSYAKEQILSDETKGLYGLKTSAVPDNVFSKISEKLDTKQDALTGTAGQMVGFDANGKPVAQDKLTGTAGQIVGFDADGNPVAQDAPSSGMEMKLLWENAALGSSFEQQTLNINSTGYQLLLLIIENMKCFFIKKSDGSAVSFDMTGHYVENTNDDNGYLRPITINDNNVVFGRSWYRVNPREIHTNNNCLKPAYIFGIKGVQM